MGTTESLLYDADPTGSEVQPPPSQEHAAGGAPRRRAPPQEGSHPPQRPQQRRRPPPQKPIQRINGLVLGGPKTGKRTLLQRLQRIDPFEPRETPVDVPPSIVIPFKPPADSPSLERIQLHVGRSRRLNQKTDFVVVMVSPGHKAEDTRPYLLHVLTAYFQQMGYSKGEDKSDRKSIFPVCICILMNFRDLKEFSSEAFDKELDELVHQLLEQMKVPPELVLLQIGSTSLRNGYGLNLLHDFIYRTYLQRRQAGLAAQLKAVTEHIDTLDETNVIPYNDFVTAQESKKPKPAEQSKEQAVEHTGPVQQAKVDPESRKDKEEAKAGPQVPTPPGKAQPQEQTGKKTAAPKPVVPLKEKPRQEEKRKILPDKQPVRIGKDALEAFLASDSEEDEAPVPAKGTGRQESSDDDDFFFDEGGTRRYNHNVDHDSDSDESSEEEEEVAPRQHGKQAQNIATPNQPREAVRQEASDQGVDGKALSPGQPPASSSSTPTKADSPSDSGHDQTTPSAHHEHSDAATEEDKTSPPDHETDDGSQASEDGASNRVEQTHSQQDVEASTTAKSEHVDSKETPTATEEPAPPSTSEQELENDEAAIAKDSSTTQEDDPEPPRGESENDKAETQKDAEKSAAPEGSAPNERVQAPTTPAAKATPVHTNTVVDDSDDDSDNFFIGDTSPVVAATENDDDEGTDERHSEPTSQSALSAKAPTRNKEVETATAPPPPTTSPQGKPEAPESTKGSTDAAKPESPKETTAQPTSGISTAALAAIQQAQREAEAMLLEGQGAPPMAGMVDGGEKRKKSKKEKKKKDPEKKKKKKKSKKAGRDEEL